MSIRDINDKIEPPISNDLKISTSKIGRFVEDMSLLFEGYKWDGETYTYTGNCLLGRDAIQMATSLLRPFCIESNLIGYQDRYIWNEQRYRVSTKFNNFLEKDMGCPSKNQLEVMEIFHNTLQNIGNIIGSSKELIRNEFGFNTNSEPKEEKLVI
jgi:hypothetical protein